VYNRVDCCASRLNNIQVFAGSKVCGSIGRAARRNTVNCNYKRASSVKVRLQRRDYLTLCEVKVYGSRTPAKKPRRRNSRRRRRRQRNRGNVGRKGGKKILGDEVQVEKRGHKRRHRGRKGAGRGNPKGCKVTKAWANAHLEWCKWSGWSGWK